MDTSVGRPAAPLPARSRRLAIAMLLARFVGWLSKTLLGRSGRTIGGRVLLALAPQAPSVLATGREVTLISATNGKSTTTAMLAAAMGAGYLTATNSDGANLAAGLVATLAENDAPQVVLEVDEAWVPWAVTNFRPARVVLLNLSRDQLHRNPEIHLVARRWRAAVAEVPVVVANVDDPAVVWAALAAEKQIWVSGGQEWNLDSVLCPECGAVLVRTPHWHCEACGLARPEPEWTVGETIARNGVPVPLHTALPGRENLGNAALAIAAAVSAGVGLEAAALAVERVTEVAGRYATWTVEGREVRLILAKNPAGYVTALRMVAESGAPILLAFNSEGVDGRDPSWLYDVDFTSLAGRPLAVCGRRGTDLATRLLLDELPVVGQFTGVVEALRALPAGPVELLANYTAFQEARKQLDDAA